MVGITVMATMMYRLFSNDIQKVLSCAAFS